MTDTRTAETTTPTTKTTSTGASDADGRIGEADAMTSERAANDRSGQTLTTADIAGACARDDNGLLFEFNGTGGLGKSDRRQHGRRAQQHDLFHGKTPPQAVANLGGSPLPLLAD